MDYQVVNLSAIETPAYKNKIGRVERILADLPRRPHLLSFSECCASDFLINSATGWATRWGIVTICGTRFNPVTSRIESTVIYPGGQVIAQKYHLSPFDQSNCSTAILQGAAPGATLTLDVNGVDGKQYPVGVGVLICYDFRFLYQDDRFANWNAVRLLVVPMWDRKYQEPQAKAGELARRYWTRCLLVNKAELRTNKRLPSTGHGPFNDTDLRMLRGLGVRKKNHRLWERREEGLLIGDYEVGIPVTLGHESAYGASFNYEQFEWIAFSRS
jgi:hypothetical protein